VNGGLAVNKTRVEKRIKREINSGRAIYLIESCVASRDIIYKVLAYEDKLYFCWAGSETHYGSGVFKFDKEVACNNQMTDYDLLLDHESFYFSISDVKVIQMSRRPILEKILPINGMIWLNDEECFLIHEINDFLKVKQFFKVIGIRIKIKKQHKGNKGRVQRTEQEQQKNKKRKKVRSEEKEYNDISRTSSEELDKLSIVSLGPRSSLAPIMYTIGLLLYVAGVGFKTVNFLEINYEVWGFVMGGVFSTLLLFFYLHFIFRYISHLGFKKTHVNREGFEFCLLIFPSMAASVYFAYYAIVGDVSYDGSGLFFRIFLSALALMFSFSIVFFLSPSEYPSRSSFSIIYFDENGIYHRCLFGSNFFIHWDECVEIGCGHDLEIKGKGRRAHVPIIYFSRRPLPKRVIRNLDEPTSMMNYHFFRVNYSEKIMEDVLNYIERDRIRRVDDFH